MRLALLFFAFFVLYTGGLWLIFSGETGSGVTSPAKESASIPSATPTKITVPVKTPPQSYVLPQGAFVSQSFNNCGPATLSMVMSMYGKSVSQDELRLKMRPFSNPFGGVDDKSIFAPEFVRYAEEYGFSSLQRPNGDVELIKTLVANDIAVIVRTWLHPNEDIGHFRVVRGYNDVTESFIQDDSYEGPNLN